MNKIDFGMPTLLELETIEDCVSFATGLGLDFIEINMNLPQFQPELIDVSALKRATESGLYFTFHLDENFNPTDFNGRVSQAYLDTALSAIELAKAVDAPVVNMHMAEGICFSLPDEKAYLYQRYNEHYLSRLLALRNACEDAAGSGITVCVENTSGWLPFMEQGVELLLDSKRFALTLDIGHNYTAGYVDEAFFKKHMTRLRHMHIHDASGSRCHMVLGDGELDLRDSLSLAAQRNCRCVIETKSAKGLRESVSYLREHGLNIR